MFKILIIAVVIIVLGTILAAVNFLSPKSVTKNPVNDPNMVSTKTAEASTSGGLLEQIKKVTSSAEPQAVSKISLEDHVTLLENTVSVLQKRLDILEKNQGIKPVSPSSSPATSITAVPAYIPLGAGGNTNDQNYFSMEAYQISIDPLEYPGYTSMQLEVSFKSDQNSGPTYVRLYNSTDSSAVTNSEVSGTSDKYKLLTSPKFTLASGRKTYVLQVKNNSNTQTHIQSARIKVSF